MVADLKTQDALGVSAKKVLDQWGANGPSKKKKKSHYPYLLTSFVISRTGASFASAKRVARNASGEVASWQESVLQQEQPFALDCGFGEISNVSGSRALNLLVRKTDTPTLLQERVIAAAEQGLKMVFLIGADSAETRAVFDETRIILGDEMRQSLICFELLCC